jgi:hypothetical protein|tara:strand:+ start:876 stop:1049 length:174 start_codon:yes stop_codon:yes gene_type:complete
MSYLGNKQLFEITNGEKLFFNGIACFMLLREIAETAFFMGAEKQGSNENSSGYFESY